MMSDDKASGSTAKLNNLGTNEPNNPTLAISANLKIPPFWSNRPDLWFIQVETQFRLKGITREQTKYDYLISSLPPESMEIVADIFKTTVPDNEKYENIKKILISRCQDTEERRLDNLLNKIELGDLKPSELYRQMETLAGGNSLINQPLLNKLWLNKLPVTIQPCIIAIESTHQQDEIFKIADRIFDSIDRPNVSSVNQSKTNDMHNILQDISARLERLEVRQSRSKSRNYSENRRSFSNNRNKYNNRSKSRSIIKNGQCWYHYRFNSNATKCVPGCKYFPNQNSNDLKN